jgi:hypothetical protein
MRNRTLAVSALTLSLLVACSGTDRELLGDPEPAYQSADDEIAAEEVYEPDPNVVPDSLAYGMFDDLRFYGSWYRLDPYGWVWRPLVVSTWAPFVNGHWAWTSVGWMWVTYDPFGWEPYQYGYWADDFTLGWVWIPAYEWSLSRCDWIVYDDYVCWAPLPPPGVSFRDPWEESEIDPWVVVPVEKFKSVDVGRARVPAKYKAGTSERTLRRQAPEAGDIERRLGHSIKPLEVTFLRSVVQSHEHTRVVLPPSELAIVEERRTNAQFRDATPAPAPAVKEAGSRDEPAAKEKSKAKTSTGTDKAKPAPQKFKSKDAPDKPQSGSDNKKGEKAKGK